METSAQYYIGIDVSSQKFDAAWLKNTARFTYRNKVLANSPTGCVEFIQWIRKHVTTELDKVHIIMEPTGVYHELLAYFLHDQGIRVSIVNPSYISDFAKSLGSLHKTDKGDSQVIARFGYERKPKAWQPEAKSVRELKAKLGRLDALKADLQREDNRLSVARLSRVPDEVMLSIHQIRNALAQSIADLEQDVHDHIDKHPDLKNDIALLQSIPGVGKETSVRMAVLYRSKQFTKASQMAAFLGLVPKRRESGKHKGKVMLSKRGNGHMRALLYFPAVSAYRYNPDIKAHCTRMLSRNKVKMQAVGAAMRKLVHICFGVLKHQTVYQPRVDFA